MGNADRYSDGQWNFYCDLCGKKGKSSDARKTWDGFQVCSRHKEERNPQDFLKGVVDRQAPPWTRPEAPDQFVLTCTPEGSSAIPGLAMPGCMLPGSIVYNSGGPFSFCTTLSVQARADFATANCATVGRC